MNPDLVLMAVLSGLANWAFRALPVLLMRGEAKPGGLMAGFWLRPGRRRLRRCSWPRSCRASGRSRRISCHWRLAWWSRCWPSCRNARSWWRRSRGHWLTASLLR